MDDQEKPQGNSNSMQIVKVYRLDENGEWHDYGTGHVTFDCLERLEDMALIVFDEKDNDTMLLHRISADDIYRKQQDTIISWRDTEYSTELALSFQEITACSYIWDRICHVQRNLNLNSVNKETVHIELKELSVVELSTLPIILKTVTESGLDNQMRVTELLLNDQDFFPKLMEVFRICEDSENMDGLHKIFKIVKGIILLNNRQIFDKMFVNELIMDIIGSLEYDPNVPQVQHHRKFLKEHVLFKEAIPIKNPIVLSKIHQTYRVGYLKDVVLTRILDEATVDSLILNSIIYSNNAVVVSLLKDDTAFMQELFSRFKSLTTCAESKKNLLYFLHEFCSLSKNRQMFMDLIKEGMCDIITDTLQSKDKKLVPTVTAILMLFLNQDPNLLHDYVVSQEGVRLLGLLVEGMITDFGEDVHCQFLEILCGLLDSGSQRHTIIDVLYEKHLSQLIDVIVLSVGNAGRAESQNRTKPEILLNICELLCFCVLHHPHSINRNFLLNNTEKVLLLTQRREKYLVVAAVRFVRTILSRHDEHVIHHFVKNNLLKPVVDVFVANLNRYNMLNSAVLELFEYIRNQNLKPLLKYVVESFWDQLVKFEHFPSIHSFKVKYEQCLENCGTTVDVNPDGPRKGNDERELEKEEEDYFKEENDDEDSACASHTDKEPRLFRLVDYDDDKNDEDYRPPPRKQTSEEDEGGMDSLGLNLKMNSKEKMPDAKKQRLVFRYKSKPDVKGFV